MPPNDSTISAVFDDSSRPPGQSEAQSESMDGSARQQAALLAFGRRANAQPPLLVLMQDAVALVAEIVEADFSGTGEVVDGGSALQLTVAATDQPGSDPAVYKGPLTADGSMASYALNTASPVVAADLVAEKRFADLFLRELGVVGALTVPLHLGGKPFGVLGVYTKEKREFTPDDVRFAETIAHWLTSSIARTKAEAELCRQRAFASTVLETVDSAVLTLDAEGRVVDINRAGRRITEFSPADVRNRPFWNVFVTPDEVGKVRGTLQASTRSRGPLEFESHVLTKDGNKKRVAWKVNAIRDKHDQNQSLVLVGIERTGQIETELESQEAKQAAEQATNALNVLRSAMVVKDPAKDVPCSPPDPAEISDSPPNKARRVRLVRRADGKVGKELRRNPRMEYQYPQKIAPMLGGVLPKQDKFFQVVCNDISAGGISFLLSEAPDFEELVVVLGKPPNETFFTARVVRIVGHQENGEMKYLVGCRFTGKVYL